MLVSGSVTAGTQKGRFGKLLFFSNRWFVQLRSACAENNGLFAMNGHSTVCLIRSTASSSHDLACSMVYLPIWFVFPNCSAQACLLCLAYQAYQAPKCALKDVQLNLFSISNSTLEAANEILALPQNISTPYPPQVWQFAPTPTKINMTMEKQIHLKMYLLFKMVMFHCHVSFPGRNIYHLNRKVVFQPPSFRGYVMLIFVFLFQPDFSRKKCLYVLPTPPHEKNQLRHSTGITTYVPVGICLKKTVKMMGSKYLCTYGAGRRSLWTINRS